MKDVSFVMIVEIYCISYMLIKYDKRIFLQKLDDKITYPFYLFRATRSPSNPRQNFSLTNIV